MPHKAPSSRVLPAGIISLPVLSTNGPAKILIEPFLIPLTASSAFLATDQAYFGI